MKTIVFFLVMISATLFAHPSPAAAAGGTHTVQKVTAPPVDSTQITISLKAKHHAFIVSLMPSKQLPDEIRYLNQVSQAITLDASGNVADTAQMITVTVSCDLVKRLYLVIGSQQERISSVFNAEIKEALFPQLYARPQLLSDIYSIAMQNAQETGTLVQAGFDFLKAIKQ
jgi:biopolymer transport protein ExbD